MGPLRLHFVGRDGKADHIQALDEANARPVRAPLDAIRIRGRRRARAKRDRHQADHRRGRPAKESALHGELEEPANAGGKSPLHGTTSTERDEVAASRVATLPRKNWWGACR